MSWKEFCICCWNKIPFSLRWIFRYDDILIKQFDKNSQSVLDLGCGQGQPMLIIKDAQSKKKLDIKSVGVDEFLPNIKFCKSHKIYDMCIHSDIRKVRFKPKSFDTVLLLDVLEHLERQDGTKILEKIETIGRKQIIVFTPVGFQPQAKSLVNKNPLEAHKSGWSPDEMRKRGYKVRGVNGIRYLRKESALIRFSGMMGYIVLFLSLLSQPFVYFLPNFAYQMICVKQIKGEKT